MFCLCQSVFWNPLPANSHLRYPNVIVLSLIGPSHSIQGCEALKVVEYWKCKCSKDEYWDPDVTTRTLAMSREAYSALLKFRPFFLNLGLQGRYLESDYYIPKQNSEFFNCLWLHLRTKILGQNLACIFLSKTKTRILNSFPWRPAFLQQDKNLIILRTFCQLSTWEFLLK